MKTERLINATCPECRGPLHEENENGLIEYACLVGHRYSPIALLIAHSDTQERALWAATLALEEAEVIGREVASHAPNVAETLIAQSKEKREQAEGIRAIVKELRPFKLD